MINYNIDEIYNANSITFDEALKKYPKYASVIKKLNSLTNYGRYDISEINFDEVNLGFNNATNSTEHTFTFEVNYIGQKNKKWKTST